MKRMAMLLVIMLLAIASVFAVNAELPKNQTECKTEVVLNLSEADVTDYRFGFTTKKALKDNQTWQQSINNMEDTPAKAEQLDMDYNKVSGKGFTNDYSVFYKVRGVSNIKLSIIAESALKGDKKNFHYTMNVNGQANAIDSETSNTWTSDTIILDKETGTAKGVIPVEIETKDALKVSDIGTYTSSLTLKITTVA